MKRNFPFKVSVKRPTGGWQPKWISDSLSYQYHFVRLLVFLYKWQNSKSYNLCNKHLKSVYQIKKRLIKNIITVILDVILKAVGIITAFPLSVEVNGSCCSFCFTSLLEYMINVTLLTESAAELKSL